MTLGPQFSDIHKYREPVQLPLFMTGSEIIKTVTNSTDVLTKDAAGFDKMWKRKIEESKREFTTEGYDDTKGYDDGHGSGTYDSLKEHGWNPNKNLVGQSLKRGKPLETHVVLRHLIKQNPDTGEYSTDILLGDAHHRVAAAAELEREGKTVYVPVEHRNPDDQYTFRRIGRR
jgi:hypothetical protein